MIAIVSVPMVLFAGVAWHDRQQAYADANDTLLKTVAVVHEHALKLFETNQLLLVQVAELLRDRSWDDIGASNDLHLYLQKMEKSVSNMSSIWLVDPTGVIRNSGLEFPMRYLTVNNRAYFDTLREGWSKEIIGEPYHSTVTNLSVFNICDALFQRDGAFNGVIVVATRTSDFLSFYQNVSDERNYGVTLFKGDGGILVGYPAAPEGAAPAPVATEILQAIKSNPARGMVEVKSAADGVRRLVAYRRLDPYATYAMFSLSEDEVDATWLRDIEAYALLTATATLLLFLTVWFAHRRVIREETALRALHDESERRQQMEARLWHAQKLQTIGQLTGGIAHDFNNLLTIIHGNLEMASRVAKDTRLNKYHNAMRSASERAQRLTQQLLSFARRQQLHPEAFCLTAKLPEFIDMVARSLRPEICLDLKIRPDLWPVFADATELERAILNVTLNAQDAMPEGGVISYRAATHHCLGESCHEGLKGDYVVLRITDSGTGMTEEIANRAFEPFFTTKEVGKGTGLGLSQVYGFAKQSGGTVEITATPGVGTTVSIYLPRGEMAEVAPAKDAYAATKKPSRERTARHVLIVEDEPQLGDFAQETIEAMGYETTLVANGRQALSYLHQDGSVDLVFSDIVMPGGLDGISLARQIRQGWPEIPIVLATGYSQSALEATKTPFPILAKPYAIATLEQTLRQFLEAPAVPEWQDNLGAASIG
jgi:two-component system NtrC family sensor kinase